jgi:zinc protease
VITSRFFLSALLLLAPLCRAAVPAAADAQTTDLLADPAVRWGRLPNGVSYAIQRHANPKGRASLRLGVRAGSFHETEKQRGLAHFLEHLAFGGSENFEPGTLVPFLQRLGMSFGADTNAYTSFDRTVYLLEPPDTRMETLDRCLLLFGDYAGRLKLPQHSIEKERGIILSEKRDRESAQARAWQAETDLVQPRTLVPARVPIGDAAVIANAPRSEFVDFYDTWYRPERMFVAAVGDFDVDAAEQLIAKHFSTLAARGPARAEPDLGALEPHQGVRVAVHRDAEMPYAMITLQAAESRAAVPDTRAKRFADLQRNLAMAMLGRRIQLIAQKGTTAVMGGSAVANDAFGLTRHARVVVASKPEDWEGALAVAEQELRRALEHGFQESELTEFVDNTRRAIEDGRAGADGRGSADIAGALVDAWMDRGVHLSPAGAAELFLPELARISADDCVRALREAWASPARYIFIAGNISIANPSDLVERAYRASSTVAVLAPAGHDSARFAYEDFGPAGRIAGRTELADLGVTQVRFENGVRLNLKVTNFEPGKVATVVRVGSGKLTEPRTHPGLNIVVSNTFQAGGLGQHDINELGRALAGRSVGVGFGVDETAFVFSGGTTRADLLPQLQLSCAWVSDPGYRPEAFRQLARSLDGFYRGLAHDVQAPLHHQVPRLLSGGDGRFGLPPQEKLSAYTGEDVRRWLEPELRHGAIEITLVGDLDPDEAIAAVARTFGALPARATHTEDATARKLASPTEGIRAEFTCDTETDRAVVSLQWPAGDALDFRRAQRMHVLASIFNDRLSRKVREEMGDTYSPVANVWQSDTYPGYGWLSATSVIAPARIDAVISAVRELAGDLAKHGVTEDELLRARLPLMVQLQTAQRQNGYWLGVLSDCQREPWRLDRHRALVATTGDIAKPEVDRLAVEVLRPERACVFISKPRPRIADANDPSAQ